MKKERANINICFEAILRKFLKSKAHTHTLFLLFIEDTLNRQSEGNLDDQL